MPPEEPAAPPPVVQSAPAPEAKPEPKPKAELPAEVAGYSLAWDLPTEDGWVSHTVAIAPNGNVAVAGSQHGNKYVRLLSAKDGQELKRVKVEASEGFRDGPSLFFLDDQQVLLMNRWFGELVDLDGAKVTKVAEKDEKDPDYLVAAFARGRLALVRKDEVRVFDTKSWKVSRTIELDLGGRPTYAAYGPDGETLALRHQFSHKAGQERPPTVRLFSRKGSRDLGVFTVESDPLAFSPDGHRLFGTTIGKAGTIVGELTLDNGVFCGSALVSGPMYSAVYLTNDFVLANGGAYPGDKTPERLVTLKNLTAAPEQGLFCGTKVGSVAACYKGSGAAKTSSAEAVLEGTAERLDGKVLEVALPRTPWIRAGARGRVSVDGKELGTVQVTAVACGHATVKIDKQVAKGDLKELVKDGAAVRVSVK